MLGDYDFVDSANSPTQPHVKHNEPLSIGGAAVSGAVDGAAFVFPLNMGITSIRNRRNVMQTEQ